MARKCYYCGKKPSVGHKVSHSNIKTKRKWNPNLRAIRAVVNGKIKAIKVCTKCLKKGKVRKAA